jgi:hypothetical protein
MGSGVRRAPLAFWLTVAAFAWSLALIAAAFVAPLYQGTTATSHGLVSTGGSTLVAQNGLGVLVPVCVPAVLAALIWLALHRRCARASHLASVGATAGIALLVVFNALAMFSIGIFVLPVTMLLACSASLTRAPRTV